MIRFNKYHVTDGKVKARVFYSAQDIGGRPCVTIYHRDYGDELYRLLPDGYKNDSDISTDYIVQGHVRLFPDSPHYPAAKARCELNAAARRPAA